MSIDSIPAFISNNWQLVINILLALIVLFSSVFRKRPNKIVDTVAEKISTLIPQFIRIAEDNFGAGHGEQKLAYVIALVQEWFNGEKLEFTDYYLKLTKLFVEQILNTPQKK